MTLACGNTSSVVAKLSTKVVFAQFTSSSDMGPSFPVHDCCHHKAGMGRCQYSKSAEFGALRQAREILEAYE